MSPRSAPRSEAASVCARLGELARRRSVEMQRLLSEFAISRLLYRLGVSAHAERFDQHWPAGGPWAPPAGSLEGIDE